MVNVMKIVELSSHHCLDSAFTGHRSMNSTYYIFRQFILRLKKFVRRVNRYFSERSCQIIRRCAYSNNAGLVVPRALLLPPRVHISVFEVQSISGASTGEYNLT